MDQASFWWSNQQQGGRSLRFRANGNTPQLVRNVATQTTGALTISFWMKFTDVNHTNNMLIFRGSQENGSCSIQWQSATNTTNPPQSMRLICNSVSTFSDAVWRDPNAWYHVVISSNGTNRTRLFFNNRLAVDNDEGFFLNGRTGWGNPHPDAGSNTGNPNNYWGGYLAECHIVDGQELEPATFGETNNRGVWVPRDVAVANYGTNGCYLPLTNPGNIGADFSGRGNNYDPTGFELGDNTSVNWDHMEDHPTRNHATLNPRNTTGGDFGIQTANLQITDTGSNVAALATASLVMRTGRYYFECVRTQEAGGGNCVSEYGIKPGDTHITGNLSGYNAGVHIETTGDVFVDGTRTETAWLPDINQGDVLSVAFNADTREVWFGRNGTFVGDPVAGTGEAATLDQIDEGYVPWIRTLGNDNSETNSVNYGQQPFRFDPPAGFQSLQTQNLPDADIQNGRDHFRVLLGPGTAANDPNFNPDTDRPGNWTADTTCPGGFDATGPVANLFNGFTNSSAVSADAQDTITFRPEGGLAFTTTVQVRSNEANQRARLNGGAWVNLTQNAITEIFAGAGTITTIDIQATTGNTVATTIQVDGRELVDMSILNLAQNGELGFPTGLWWIKDRDNDNHHQLVDVVRGANRALWTDSDQSEQAYAAPAGNCVAWCWNAPNFWENTAGTNGASLASQGRRNVNAGFSIIRYTGNTTSPQTIAHGLNEAPEFMIFRRIQSNSNTIVGGIGIMPLTDSILLNSDAAQFTAGTFGGAVNNNIITLGGSGTVLTSDDDYICYAWHSVPGYSAFGSYTGNADAGEWPPNSPFIYCGFRPAFVMVKNTRFGDWEIADSTRDPHNLCTHRMRPNTDDGDGATGVSLCDFTANGFKVWNQSNQWNGDGDRIIYAAWAENPTGGNNVAPATAR